MKKEDALNILTAMKKSYLSLGIPDPEAVGALDMAIKAIQTDNSEKVYQKAFEDIRAELEVMKRGTIEMNKEIQDDFLKGQIDVYKYCIRLIDKHNPDKVENEGKE